MADNIDTTYLNFDAYSIKSAIEQKISEDPNYSDYLYEGSNISILIELFSIVFQNLMYNLNATASESMFSDTTIYENINRLVKFIGYNPKGYITSGVDVNLKVKSGCIIPQYAYVTTNTRDSNGKEICFSTINSVKVPQNTDANNNIKTNLTTRLYNGRWKLLPTINIAKGTDYESFTLQIYSDSLNSKYIAYPYVDVYIKHYTTGDYEKYTRVDNLFTSNSTSSPEIYSSADKVYELRLNADKSYSIRFGNNIHGAKLEENDEVYVFYLDSNGPYGKISPGDLTAASFKFSASTLGISQALFDSIFSFSTDEQTTLNTVTATNILNSSTPSDEESVEEIRENAPSNFITGGRLVTQKDVEGWITRNYSSDIHDCVAMNNWKYITEFYGWLYNLGITKHGDGSTYIKPTIFKKFDLAYTDAADCNSIYVWCKTLSNSIIPSKIITDISTIKPLTSNITLLQPLTVKFNICAADIDYVKENYFDETTGIYSDPTNESYLEITVSDSLKYSPTLIKSTVKNKIVSFFNETNFLLGSTVNLNDLYNNILSIPGVDRVRTIFDKEGYQTIIYPGLCMASWTSTLIDPKDDLIVSPTPRKLENFQQPELNTTNIEDAIVVITQNTNFTNSI